MKLNQMKAAAAIVVTLGFVVWLLVGMRAGIGRVLLFLGLSSLCIAGFAHLCEALQLFPAMGWSLPRTPASYLQLDSTVAGLALLTAGFCFSLRKRSGI
jgi:hypothetical protein